MTTVRILPVTTLKGHREIEAADRLCFPDDVPIAVHTAAWWIAKVDGTWAGYAGGQVFYLRKQSGETECVIYFCRVGVLPDFRGQGLQVRLIRKCERWARKCGAVAVVTDTVPWGCASMNSMIKAGYKTWIPLDPWREAGAVYWRRDL